MKREKEILELRKLYLIQFEKFETKVFFTFLTLGVTLIILYFKMGISYWWGLGVLLFTTIILDSILQYWRKNSFNKLIEEVNIGEISLIK